MSKLSVYKAKVEGKEVSVAFANLNKTVTIPRVGKVKLADALANPELMEDLIALGYGSLITGDAAEKAVRNYNEALEAQVEQVEAEQVEEVKETKSKTPKN